MLKTLSDQAKECLKQDIDKKLKFYLYEPFDEVHEQLENDISFIARSYFDIGTYRVECQIAEKGTLTIDIIYKDGELIKRLRFTLNSMSA